MKLPRDSFLKSLLALPLALIGIGLFQRRRKLPESYVTEAEAKRYLAAYSDDLCPGLIPGPPRPRYIVVNVDGDMVDDANSFMDAVRKALHWDREFEREYPEDGPAGHSVMVYYPWRMAQVWRGPDAPEFPQQEEGEEWV